jgi:septal ring factor EnvC (AmiA/AmiB activator)
LEEQKQRESGFVQQVAEKNTIISGLWTDITSLQTELQNCDETIEEYETSFGQILAQSIKLSTKCIMNTMQFLGLYSN